MGCNLKGCQLCCHLHDNGGECRGEQVSNHTLLRYPVFGKLWYESRDEIEDYLHPPDLNEDGTPICVRFTHRDE